VLREADYDTSAGEDGLGVGIYKMAVTHAEKGDTTMLRIITEMVNAIKTAEGRMKLHKMGIGKMLWKKKETRTRGIYGQ
jgi:hypothetical protein